MFGSKYLNYLDWRSGYYILVVKKEHIGLNKLNTYKNIKLIKDGMNTERKFFN